MEENVTFHYNYSASENREISEIRKKYLPPEENKLEALRRLDRRVQNAGTAEGLCLGIPGSLVFGVGLCLGLNVLPGGIVPAVIFAAVGAGLMIAAYPVSRRVFRKTRAKYAPQILALAEEVSRENL